MASRTKVTKRRRAAKKFVMGKKRKKAEVKPGKNKLLAVHTDK